MQLPRKFAIVVLFLHVICLYSAPARADLGPCYGSIRKALSAGGFQGEPDCKRIDVKIAKIGNMKRAHDVLELYLLTYRTIPESGLVAHGGKNLIILSNNKYIGQYSLSMESYEKIIISNNNLKFDPEIPYTNVDLGSDGLPKSIYINGYNFSLSK